MKLRRSFAIIIVVLFLLVAGFSFASLFSVKKVDATFSVSDDTKISDLQSRLDEFLNKNIIFLDKQEVYDAFSDFHYMEIVSVNKKYPNVIEVNVLERREVYYLDYGTNYLVTTENGFILKSISKNSVVDDSRDKIILTLDGVSVLESTIGKTVKTDNDELLSTVFEMAKSVNLTDCIKGISVFSMGSEFSDVTFSTYTGVDIVIEKAELFGVDKVKEGFSAYDQKASDYEKMFSKLVVFIDKDGKIQVNWTKE